MMPANNPTKTIGRKARSSPRSGAAMRSSNEGSMPLSQTDTMLRVRPNHTYCLKDIALSQIVSTALHTTD